MADNEQSEFVGLLEPRAEALARQLHDLAASGNRVSDAGLLTPMLTSMAISAKRSADAQQRIAAMLDQIMGEGAATDG